MRVLMSGGTGLLGRALTECLLARNDQVIILTRSPGTARARKGVVVAGWDGKTTAGWGHLVEEVDAVVSLTGENLGSSPWSRERLQAIRDSRVLPGQALARAVREAARRPEVFIQQSGTGYYGTGDDVKTEASPPGDDLPAKISIEWEASSASVEEFGVRRVVTRTGVVLTAKVGILPYQALPFRLFIGGPLGSGRQWISWIHLHDYVEGISFILDRREIRGPVNLTSPNPLTNAEYGRILGRVLRRPYWAPAPGFALRLVLGKMSTLVLDGQRAVPQKLVDYGFRFRYPDLEAALRDIYSGEHALY